MAAPALITGGRGLLGHHALRHWDVLRHRPVVVGRESDLLVPGAARALVQRTEPSLVLHLAWCASATVGYRQHPDNAAWVEASWELYEAAREVGATFAATGSAVDESPGTDAYSRGKAALRRRLAAAIEGGTVTWMRPYYVVAPVEGRPEVVAAARRAAAAGRPVRLRTPAAAHDFVHVADVGRAVSLLAQGPPLGSADIGTGRTTSVSSLLDALGLAWTADPTADTVGQVPTADTVGQVPTADTVGQVHAAADTGRLRALGWRPTSTEELLARGR